MRRLLSLLRDRLSDAGPLAALLTAAAAAGVCAAFVDRRCVSLTAALLAVAALGVIWPWLTMRAVSARLRFASGRVRENETAAATLMLRNRLPWPAWGLRVVGLPEAMDPGPLAAPASGGAERAWEFAAPRRGVFPAAEAVPTLVCGFPFGLWEARRAVVLDGGPLVVWPRMVSAGPLPEDAASGERDGAAPSRRAGTGGDPMGVRPWRHGDSPRRVHWAQTARHDRLMVTERQATHAPRVVVLLDLDRAVYDEDDAREQAIRLAVGLWRDWGAAGARVDLRWAESPADLDAGFRGGSLPALLDALAHIGDGPGVPLRDLAAAAATHGLTRSSVGLVAVITSERGRARAADALPRGAFVLMVDTPDPFGASFSSRAARKEAAHVAIPLA